MSSTPRLQPSGRSLYGSGDDDIIGLLDDKNDDVIELPEEEAIYYRSRKVPANSKYQHLASLPNGERIILHPGTRGCGLKCRDGNFFYCKFMAKSSGIISLYGHHLKKPEDINRRLSRLHGFPLPKCFPQQVNELCVVVHTHENGPSKLLDQEHLDVIPLAHVERIHEVRFTNMDFPAFSYLESGRYHADNPEEKAKIRRECPCVCRWKYVEEIDTTGRKIIAQRYQAITSQEADPGRGIHDVLKARRFLDRRQTKESSASAKRKADDSVDLTQDDQSDGDIQVVSTSSLAQSTRRSFKRRNGSHIFPSNANASVAVSTTSTKHAVAVQLQRQSVSTRDESVLQSSQRTISMIDCCSGGGLTVRAAVDEGIHVKCAVEIHPVFCKSLRLNFGRTTKILHMDIAEFAATMHLNENGEIDIVHFSPPCQSHSMRNRRLNPDRPEDAQNEAVMYALDSLLKNYCPRRVTIEQTSHIMCTNEGRFFRSMILMLTDHGYSAASKVLNCLNFGVPSSRKRLIVLGACPGETLPFFPKPTHGLGPGLQPPTTVGSFITSIPPNATLHDIAKAQTQRRNLPVAHPNKPLQNIQTTVGIQALHPNGKRWFTIREHLALMTAPAHHQLYYKVQKHWTTQVGNGVPCLMYRAVLREVIKSIRHDDVVRAEYKPAVIHID